MSWKKQLRRDLARRNHPSLTDRQRGLSVGRGRSLVFEMLEGRRLLAADFGDAPAPYPTLLEDDGPRHETSLTRNTLFLGASVDSEADAAPSATAAGDDQFSTPARNDEDGVFDPSSDLMLRVGSSPRVRVRATNSTGVEATIFGWIDINRDGVFDNATERSATIVPPGTHSETFSIDFPNIPYGSPSGTTFARFRISTDPAASDPAGPAFDGEVEDYQVLVNPLAATPFVVEESSELKPKAPTSLQWEDGFGSAIASIGDVDGDGIGDLAVGAYGDNLTGGVAKGAFHILFMNDDYTVRESRRVGDGAGGVYSSLSSGDAFGSSIAAIGDLDGNGVPDLAVGAPGDDSGELGSGAIYILFMQRSGHSTAVKIGSQLGGGPALPRYAGFGSSVASIGDFNGDGVNDLAVGAEDEDYGQGAVYLLYMETDGSVKDSHKVASGIGGGPELLAGAEFGSAVVALGDINGDGVTDLAVGADSDRSGDFGGAVYLLQMGADGQVLSSQKTYAPADSGAFEYGHALAVIGDQDGDGLNDLVVGSPGSEHYSGAVFLWFVNSDGTLREGGAISRGLSAVPVLSNGDRYGDSIAFVGDHEGDGFVRLLVGASADDHTSLGNARYGILHSHTIAPDFAPWLASVERPSQIPESTNADALVFRLTFSEPVSPVGSGDLVVVGGASAAVSGVTAISSSVYEVTVEGGDLGGFNGQVSIRLAPNPDIYDLVGQQAIGREPLVDERYYVDNIPPELVSVHRATDPGSAPDAATLDFTATFDGDVFGVDASDFVAQGVSAPIEVEAINAHTYSISVNTSGVSAPVYSVGIALAPEALVSDAAGNSGPLRQARTSETYSFADFGDAPASYSTLLEANGARHSTYISGAALYLGATIDVENDGLPSPKADGDDRYTSPGQNDEDGVVEAAHDLVLTIGGAPRVRLRATNDTGDTAMLYGWIDIDQDGTFDNTSERASVEVPAGSLGEVFTLEFPQIPVGASTGTSVARFRLSTDLAAAEPVGAAYDGEVEDYSLEVVRPHSSVFTDAGYPLLSSGMNGVPIMQSGNAFGSSIAVIGDLDGNGVDDLVVGAPMDHGNGHEEGAAFVLFLSHDGSVINSVEISEGFGGGPTLGNGNHFGSAVAAIGDLNGDGVTDIAVGAEGGSTSGTLLTNSYGAVHILYLQTDGTAKHAWTITDEFFGNRNPRPLLGSSIAPLGDRYGDGTPDIAVGVPRPEDAPDSGGAYVLDLEGDETIGRRYILQDGRSRLGNFGAAVASVGDLNGDGTSEIAVGSPRYEIPGFVEGRVEVFVSGNSSRSLVGHGHNKYGGSLSAVADADGDGYSELVIGGASSIRPAWLGGESGILKGYGPTYYLPQFTGGMAQLGDLDGDGIIEFAVGAEGGIKILTFLPDTEAPITRAIRRSASLGESTQSDVLAFEVEFSDVVAGVGIEDFQVDGATSATVTTVARLSPYVYEVSVAGGDLNSFSGRVGLNLALDLSITDASGNSLQPGEPTIDEAFTLDNTPPKLLEFSRLSPGSSATALDVLRFGILFDEPVQNVDLADFVVAGPSVDIDLRPIDDTRFVLTLTGDDLSSYGSEIGLDLSPHHDITDRVGLALGLGEPSVDETFLIVPYGRADYGDAPGSYPSLASQGGAAHGVLSLSGPRLGESRDLEPDGRPSPLAEGDGSSDDGVSTVSMSVGQHGAEVIVNVQGADGRLDAWIDFNGDGSWGGVDEQVFSDTPVSVGDNLLRFNVPASATSGSTFARFRISTDGGLGYGGIAADGEVEDYEVVIEPPPRASGEFTADAPFTWASSGFDADDFDATDLDRDGDIDFVIATSTGKLLWVERDAGTYVEHDLGVEVSEFAVTDLDHDGDDDIAATHFNSVTWLRNEGEGVFTLYALEDLPDDGTAISAADIDGDSHLDLVVTTSGYGFYVYPGFGNGFLDQTFVDVDYFGFSIRPSDIDLADLDRDGDLDLLVAGSGSWGAFSTHTNEGVSGFSNQQIESSSTFRTQAIDFDSDGDQDAVVLNSSGVALARNDSGSFSWVQLATFTTRRSGEYPEDDLLAADIDGDGDTDVIASTASGVTLLRNDGNSTFTQVDLATAPARIAVADADSDGYLEIITAGSSTRSITVYQQPPSAGIASQRSTLVESETYWIRFFIDRPTTEDFIVPFALSGEAVLGVDYEVTGASSLDGPVGTVTIPAGELFAELEFAIADDGVPELAEAIDVAVADTPYAQRLLAILGDADIADYGDAPSPYPVNTASGGAVHWATGPYLGAARTTEGAGFNSADAAGDAGDDGVVFAATYPGNASSQVTVELSNAPAGAMLDAWIDFDGDGTWNGPGEHVFASQPVSEGENQLLFTTPGWASPGQTAARFRVSTAGGLGIVGAADNGEVEDYTFTIAPAKGTPGTFATTTIGAPDDEATYPKIVDFDRDGDLDVVYVLNRSTIAWQENLGEAGFAEHIIGALATQVTQTPEVVDLDGDGRLDVLTFGSVDGGDDAFVEFLQSDDGFVAVEIPAGLDSVSTYVPGDIDSDGDTDLLVTGLTTISDNRSSTYEKIVWLENDGSGVFSRHLVSFDERSPAIPVFVNLADLNGDGHLDFVTSGASRVRITVFENDGRQEFTARVVDPRSSQSLLGAGTLATGDLDLDGDTDLIATSGIYHLPGEWYENDGTGNFAIHASTWAYNASIVTTADIDGDGDLDAVYSGGPFLTWQENSLRGDFNADQIVDDADYEVWRSSYGEVGAAPRADGNADGRVDAADYTVWRNARAAEPERVFVTRIAGRRGWFGAEVGDLDGDGDLDIVSGGYDGLTWFVNAPAVHVTASGTDLLEGGEPIEVTFTRTEQLDQDFTLDLLPRGEAGLNIDYTAGGLSHRKIVIPAGSTSATITLEAIDDVLPELDEPYSIAFLGGADYAVTGTSWLSGLVRSDEVGGDFGDAPSAYLTLVADDGARHSRLSDVDPRLGATRSDSSDAAPSADAEGDVDDDGVLLTAVQAGQQGATATVEVQGSAGLLDGWIDFNGNGRWEDDGEQVFSSVPVGVGLNDLTFNVPTTARLGTAYARFRVSTDGQLDPTGLAADGEVEDYPLLIEEAPAASPAAPTDDNYAAAFASLATTPRPAVRDTVAPTADLAYGSVNEVVLDLLAIELGRSRAARPTSLAVARPSYTQEIEMSDSDEADDDVSPTGLRRGLDYQ